MRNALILLFLISSYNFLLWYITKFGLSPVPLFPDDIYNTVLVLSFNSVLYISWLFGERHRVVLWIGYLFFFQIIVLAVLLGRLDIVVMDLPPVVLTFALVVLFESPVEREIREVIKEREKLLREIDRTVKERQKIEVSLRLLKKEIDKLEEEKRSSELSKEQVEELEARLKKLQEELKEYKDKEKKLLESNKKLFHLLEHMKEGNEYPSGKGEVASLRKERKRLIKEVLQLQELVSLYSEETEGLKADNQRLKSEIESLKLRLSTLEIEKENIKRDSDKAPELLREVLSDIFGLEFSTRAIRELLNLPPQKRRVFLKELRRFSDREGKENVRALATLPDIFKLRFSGGRIYLRRTADSWEVVGLLDSEDDKEKERYIREVLSKID